MFHDQILGYVDAVSIVGCYKEHAVLFEIVNDMYHTFVVAIMCVF